MKSGYVWIIHSYKCKFSHAVFCWICVELTITIYRLTTTIYSLRLPQTDNTAQMPDTLLPESLPLILSLLPTICPICFAKTPATYSAREGRRSTPFTFRLCIHYKARWRGLSISSVINIPYFQSLPRPISSLTHRLPFTPVSWVQNTLKPSSMCARHWHPYVIFSLSVLKNFNLNKKQPLCP